MKTNGLIFLVLFMAVLAACSNDDSYKGESTPFPAQPVETAFWAKYPSASSVQWEQAGVFQKAEFVLNSGDYDAWFNASGVWLQTEYTSTYTNLPSAIKDYVANSINYPPTSWTPQQSVEVVERLNYPVWYEIDLKKGNDEVSIWADAEAYNHFDALEDFDQEDVPQLIRSFLAVNYTNGWITEGMKLTNGSYVVNLLSGNQVKQVNFNRSMEWTYTGWPVLANGLPEAVQAVLKGNAYKDYSIKTVEYQQHSDKEYYHIVLENTNLPGNPTISVNIGAEGNLFE